jgi:hypothetical protein
MLAAIQHGHWQTYLEKLCPVAAASGGMSSCWNANSGPTIHDGFWSQGPCASWPIRVKLCLCRHWVPFDLCHVPQGFQVSC